jgi:BirA family biotin operon repressor/biotin-[acetyl-CoA-carboxylase] ligase
MTLGDKTIDASILSALRGAPVSGGELARKLSVSRAAVWAHVEALRAIGYDIEAGPHLGYRLLSVPDVLHADDLYSRLGRTKVIGREIQVFEKTTSTNDLMLRLARGGVKEGAVIFAESQSKGRGRLGRNWMSPARKGLWFSVLLRPDMQPQAATQLTIAASTALARAITLQTGIVPEIKWPNDILIRGRKVAGILTEMSAELDHLKDAILGIGIDVNLEASEFPVALRKTATSIRIESGQTADRAALAVAVLRELDRDYERIKDGEFDVIAEQWHEHCSTIGSLVNIRIGDRVVRGRAESLDADGALLLRGQHGHLERIIGGDVTMEK